MLIGSKIKIFSVFLVCICCYIFISSIFGAENDQTVSRVNVDKFSLSKERRYILYDVNRGEGFNLRRDVYMRVANLVRGLRERGENFVLVLPPWGPLYHWQSAKLSQQMKIPWSLFFDLESLNRFVPAIEFKQYLKETAQNKIDLVYYLQRYAEGWTHWEEKFDFRPCIEEYYYKDWDGKWRSWFFGYEDVYAVLFYCVSIQGQSSTLFPLILAENITAMSIMFERAETVMHDNFGDVNYWKARRSMRYNKELIEIGNAFRRIELESNDVDDNTVLPEDWTVHKVVIGSALGGPYVCHHWRRKDFARSHSQTVPSINGTADQLSRILEKLNLDVLFLSTDAPDSEVDELVRYLPSKFRIKRFIPSNDILQKYKDGGVSIIDQWICAHARYFTGTHTSTFSFRIQEDREILGFNHNVTFNNLCADAKPDCEQPAQWKLVQ